MGVTTVMFCDERHPRFLKRWRFMKEKDIEKRLREEVKKAGGLCLKFTPASWSGAPDRLILFPGGKIFFVELKRPGEEPRPLQKVRIRKLREMGFHAEVLDNVDRIPGLIGDCKSDWKYTCTDDLKFVDDTSGGDAGAKT